MSYDPRSIDETPFGTRLVPRLSLRMRNTEILTVVYRSEASAVERLLPSSLSAIGSRLR